MRSFCVRVHTAIVYAVLGCNSSREERVNLSSSRSIIPVCSAGQLVHSISLKQNEAQSAREQSTHKGVNLRSKYVTQVQQHEDIPLVEFIYLVFTRKPGESYRRRLRSLLLYSCYVFRLLINSLAC